MKPTKFLPILTVLVGMLSSCQLGPFYYTLDRDADGHKEPSIHHTGHHGAGHAYKASKEACLLARDLTDQELDDAYPYPGVGYDDSKWCGENADEVEVAAQQYFDCEDGTGFILNDEGDLIQVKLHFFEGENGKKYIFDDETGDMQEFIFDEVVSAKLS